MPLRRKHIEAVSINQNNQQKCHDSHNCADAKRKRRNANKRRRQFLAKQLTEEVKGEGRQVSEAN